MPITGERQESLTIGERIFTNLSELKILTAVSSGTNRFCTPREMNSSSGYTPSGSNNFRILAIQVVNVQANPSVNIHYGNNDVGQESGSDSTSPQYIGGNANISTLINTSNWATGVFTLAKPLDFLVPNGKFVTCESGGGSQVALYYIYGYEEAP